MTAKAVAFECATALRVDFFFLGGGGWGGSLAAPGSRTCVSSAPDPTLNQQSYIPVPVPVLGVQQKGHRNVNHLCAVSRQVTQDR